MATIVKPVGYTGGLQRLVWTNSQSVVQAYLWGAGGGGGGDEGSDDPGGNGSGGAFTQYNFVVNPGDVITVAVGQGGTGGSPTPGSSPGQGGNSLYYRVFNLRGQSNLVPVSDPRWSSFMNAHAVWDPGGRTVTPIFRSFTVNFPVTGEYVFQYSADDAMSVQIDGVNIISYSGFTASPPPFISRFVTAGNHTINVSANNSGGDVAGVALIIDASFSGANGGRGSAGSNGGGAGGGGGGATVLLVNNVVQAVAGGGGGGGGAGGNGNTPGTSGPDGPGPWGYPNAASVTLAQDGQGSSVGGGGGGGGGGQSGGNGGRRGGASPSNPNGAGDFNATAGSFGQSVGSSTDPNGRNPGGTSNQYYTKSSRGGFGGTKWASSSGQNGQNGAATFVFDVSSNLYVRNANLWTAVKNVYIKHNGQWIQPSNVYVKNNGSWESVLDTDPPFFSGVSGGFGRFSRQ